VRVPAPDHQPDGEKAKETLQAAFEAVQTTSDNVRTAAASYEAGDEANAVPFTKQLASARIATVQPDSPVANARIGTVQPKEPDGPAEREPEILK
jgi:hypothetical protein